VEASKELLKDDLTIYRKSGQVRRNIHGRVVSRIPEEIIQTLKGILHENKQ
jgi:hypothetical protein